MDRNSGHVSTPVTKLPKAGHQNTIIIERNHIFTSTLDLYYRYQNTIIIERDHIFTSTLDLYYLYQNTACTAQS